MVFTFLNEIFFRVGRRGTRPTWGVFTYVKDARGQNGTAESCIRVEDTIDIRVVRSRTATAL